MVKREENVIQLNLESRRIYIFFLKLLEYRQIELLHHPVNE